MGVHVCVRDGPCSSLSLRQSVEMVYLTYMLAPCTPGSSLLYSRKYSTLVRRSTVIFLRYLFAHNLSFTFCDFDAVAF